MNIFKNLNWKIRFKNWGFLIQIGIAIVTPIFAYSGLSYSDITTWGKLFDLIMSALKNPYVLMLIAASVINAVIDPTSTGIRDSARVMDYDKPSR